MRAYTLGHLRDEELLRALAALVARDRVTTAELLAHIAEVDARRLYRPAGYPSMAAYCVGELRLSEDAALRRIQAARTARQFPVVFEAVADGRLHLTAVCLLAPYLTRENAGSLLTAAAGRTKAEITEFLAHRFPGTESLPLVMAIPNGSSRSTGPGQVVDSAPSGSMIPTTYAAQHALAHVDGSADPANCNCHHAPQPVVVPPSKLAPVAPERYVLQLTIGKGTHEKLRHAQALLSHRVPSGDLAALLDLALDALTGQLEKRKFAATTKPQAPRRRTSASPRHIPAHVKRAVWTRDGGRCTFVGEGGHRCGARKFLEYDHVEPVAHGGQATPANLRLRCRAHNQLEAERVFGAAFMEGKRNAARRAVPRTRSAPRSPSTASEHSRDVTACLRELGFRTDQVRRATAYCEQMPDATLEERVRAALKLLCPKARVRGGSAAAGRAGGAGLERAAQIAAGS